MPVTPHTKAVLSAILDWDQARIAEAKKRTPWLDRSDYEARMAKVKAALDVSPLAWDHEVTRYYVDFFAVLGHTELAGHPAPMVRQLGEGKVRARITVPGASAVERSARVVAAAEEIGILRTMQQCASSGWRATKGR